MTVTSLTRSREYLADQRRSIIARSVAGSLAGAIPIPFLDDWVLSLVLGSGYRRIAAAHHIDLDDESCCASPAARRAGCCSRSRRSIAPGPRRGHSSR
ncbi:MAG: hypothetical protein E6J90_43785 [Deltaproteobacteria bacterium]|nr:MAG: hypothetical protein E6J90_43785 [Deltaproteobacteria bacterium]